MLLGEKPPHLSRSSSSQSTTWTDSTIHNDLNVKIEVNASTLSVDATGSVAVLAARKGLYVIDLESPYQPSRTLHHQTKWDVTVVKCNPHAMYKGLVASTSNHNTLLWNIDHNASNNGLVPSHQPLMATLRAHTRPVSDVAWSPSEPTILATCSADTKTHLWDTRTPQKPVQTLCAFTTSATQVEWNRLDPTSLATAHDGEVRVWDTRSCDKPAAIITAHMQKIYGLDWSPSNMHELVTCSEDKTVKFWNVLRPRVCQGSLATNAPVWRARYTPFGDGLVTTSHRQDCVIRLWSLNHDGNQVEAKQVHDFVGHRDLVKGFAWRAHDHAFQLVSWSKNQELRMWHMDRAHLEACGLTTAKTLLATEPEVNRRSEAAHLVFKFDLAALKSDFVPLVLPATAVSLQWNQANVLAFVDEEEELAPPEAATVDAAPGAESVEDARAKDALPCPRMSGACFSGPNMLVVFDSRVAIGQSKLLPSSATTAILPKTYAGLQKLSDASTGLKSVKKQTLEMDYGWSNDPDVLTMDDEMPTADDAHTFFPSDALTPRSTALLLHADYMDNNATLTLSVSVSLLDCSRFCGEFGQPLASCAAQAARAVAAGQVELGQMWSMLAISAQEGEPPATLLSPWSAHPLGASLVQHVLELYEKAGDVPTLAAIVCALDSAPTPAVRAPEPVALCAATDEGRRVLRTGSQQYLVSPMAHDTPLRSTSVDASLARNYVLPRSPVTSVINESLHEAVDEEPPLPAPANEAVALLSAALKDRDRYDEYRRAYGDVLYHYGALNTRCEMLKHLSTTPAPHEGLTLALYCHACGHPTSELYCAQCKDFSIKCSVCELVVRGESMFCMLCGHGGHRAHLATWFATENACPTGCGCWCSQPPRAMEFPMALSPPNVSTALIRSNSLWSPAVMVRYAPPEVYAVAIGAGLVGAVALHAAVTTLVGHVARGLARGTDAQWRQLARASMTRRDWAEAATQWTHAIEINATDASYFKHRGECHLHLKAADAAWNDFAAAVRLDPTESALKSEIARRSTGNDTFSSRVLQPFVRACFGPQTTWRMRLLVALLLPLLLGCLVVHAAVRVLTEALLQALAAAARASRWLFGVLLRVAAVMANAALAAAHHVWLAACAAGSALAPVGAQAVDFVTNEFPRVSTAGARTAWNAAVVAVETTTLQVCVLREKTSNSRLAQLARVWLREAEPVLERHWQRLQAAMAAAAQEIRATFDQCGVQSVWLVRQVTRDAVFTVTSVSCAAAYIALDVVYPAAVVMGAGIARFVAAIAIGLETGYDLLDRGCCILASTIVVPVLLRVHLVVAWLVEVLGVALATTGWLLQAGGHFFLIHVLLPVATAVVAVATCVGRAIIRLVRWAAMHLHHLGALLASAAARVGRYFRRRAAAIFAAFAASATDVFELCARACWHLWRGGHYFTYRLLDVVQQLYRTILSGIRYHVMPAGFSFAHGCVGAALTLSRFAAKLGKAFYSAASYFVLGAHKSYVAIRDSKFVAQSYAQVVNIAQEVYDGMCAAAAWVSVAATTMFATAADIARSAAIATGQIARLVAGLTMQLADVSALAVSATITAMYEVAVELQQALSSS
ncbi:hypothetical protein ACHHYP_09134 [Achlya hypogyna]|uniref:WDR59/RTC1-like RING zinc finger domain-containing protein n=1 Tax=Achlya hypogyna TaxID=1202772 RepID=A0A1V9YNL2_ACHHY|nr:hypothetical protein ACHHYP_09134 [Achlya hypogyna]